MDKTDGIIPLRPWEANAPAGQTLSSHPHPQKPPERVAFDGNTVELNVEQAQYGKAAAEYQATVNFLQDKIGGLRKALRGD